MSKSHCRLLVLGCVLGVVSAAATAQALDPTHLPPDTEVVVTIDLRQLLNSPLAKSNQETVRQLRTMAESLLADADAQRYLEKIDFDPLRDVDRIVVSSSGSKTPECILLEGRFHPTKIAAAGKEATDEHPEHIKGVKIDGHQVYEIHVDAGTEGPVYAGLVGKDRMIVTHTKDAFADAITRIKSGSKTSKLSKALRESLEANEGKRGISFVATGAGLVKLTEDTSVPNIDLLQRSVLQKVATLDVSVTLDQDVNFALVINTKDKMSADEIATLANIGVAGAKLALKNKVENHPEYAQALRIVDTMRVSSKGNTIELTGKATAETLGKILKYLPQK